MTLLEHYDQTAVDFGEQLLPIICSQTNNFSTHLVLDQPLRTRPSRKPETMAAIIVADPTFYQRLDPDIESGFKKKELTTIRGIVVVAGNLRHWLILTKQGLFRCPSVTWKDMGANPCEINFYPHWCKRCRADREWLTEFSQIMRMAGLKYL